jgi:hypothetical protein
MLILRSSVLILLLFTSAFAGQSRILNYLGEKYKKLGLPTFAEYGWVMNLVNVYGQASGFVRSTNQLVRSYKRCYQEQLELKERIEETWGSIQRMYSLIDPYDMDTWAVTLDRAQNIIWFDCADILDAFGQKDYIVLTSDYISDIDSVFNYKYRARKNSEVVNKYYRGSEYDSLENLFILSFDEYRNSSIGLLRVQLQSEQAILSDPNTTQAEKNIAQSRIDDLISKINEIEKDAFEKSSYRIHLDTIIELTSALIAYNLTELQVVESQIAGYEAAADKLRGEYTDLRDGVITSRPKSSLTSLSDESLNFTDSKIYGTDANLVTPPERPELKASLLKGRDVSAHDILHLQNAINTIALKQESLLRDIALIKAKTMTVVTISEAYNRQLHERQAMEQVFDAKLLSTAAEEIKK